MPDYLLIESGGYLLTESGDRILLEQSPDVIPGRRRPQPHWPPHQKRGPGAVVNFDHPLARGLTRCHLVLNPRALVANYTTNGDYDLIHGLRRKPTEQSTNNVVRRLAPNPVGTAVHIHGSEWIASRETFPNSTEQHGDWDPEENGTKPRAPFTAAVLIESTDTLTSNRWPMVLVCQNGNGTRAGFEIALFSSNVDNFPNFVAWTTGSQNSATYGKNPGGSVLDGKPHLLVGGVNAQGRAWLSLDGRWPVVSDNVLTSGNYSMRGKPMVCGSSFSDAAPSYMWVYNTRIGGWMFWKRELRPDECRTLWEELYSHLIVEVPVRRRPSALLAPPVAKSSSDALRVGVTEVATRIVGALAKTASDALQVAATDAATLSKFGVTAKAGTDDLQVGVTDAAALEMLAPKAASDTADLSLAETSTPAQQEFLIASDVIDVSLADNAILDGLDAISASDTLSVKVTESPANLFYTVERVTHTFTVAVRQTAKLPHGFRVLTNQVVERVMTHTFKVRAEWMGRRVTHGFRVIMAGRSEPTDPYYVTHQPDPDADLVYTTVDGSIQPPPVIEYVAGPPSTPISVVVDGNEITVILGTDANGNVISTADDIAAAIEASTPASALVTVTPAPGSDGSGIARPMPPASLSGTPLVERDILVITTN